MTLVSADRHPIDERPRLIRLAYRMLGSVSDAEDVVQDAFLRLSVQTPSPTSPAAWLTTVTTRLAIDRLRRNKARRETYPGPWLPDPVETGRDDEEPELSTGMMLMLERLSPEERAAFTLREGFDTPYSEIAAMLDKSEPAVRQIVSRAKSHIRQHRENPPAPHGRHTELMQAFMASVLSGNVDAIKATLAADVVMHTDGGGRRSAALRAISGRDDVAQLIHFLVGKRARVREARMLSLNGAVGFWFVDGDGDGATVQIEASPNGITAIYSVRNPEKLTHLFQR